MTLPNGGPSAGVPVELEALGLFRIDLNAARDPAGRAVVLMTVSTPGAHMTVALPETDVEHFVAELRRQADAARHTLIRPNGAGGIPINGKGV